MWKAAAKAAPLFRRPPIRADNHQGLLIKKRPTFLYSNAYPQNRLRRGGEVKIKETYKPASNRLKGRLKTCKHLFRRPQSYFVRRNINTMHGKLFSRWFQRIRPTSAFTETLKFPSPAPIRLVGKKHGFGYNLHRFSSPFITNSSVKTARSSGIRHATSLPRQSKPPFLRHHE